MGRYREDYTRDNYSSLIGILEKKRNTFCGIGTRKVKIRLNKLAKTDTNAMLYRKALEIEGKNISAKKYRDQRDMYYEQKSELITEFIEICKVHDILCGYHMIEGEYEYPPTYIVYFELPNCEQISWHTFNKPNCSIYEREWDKKNDSTLTKLETAILMSFPDISK